FLSIFVTSSSSRIAPYAKTIQAPKHSSPTNIGGAMRISMKAILLFSSLIFVSIVFFFCTQASAQTSSGTLQGVITDPTNAVVPGASVQIHNPVSGYDRTVTTDGAGRFTISNIPFNPYHLTVTGKGFAPYS